MNPAATVVIPARNARATIGGTLAALAAQQTEDAYDVIVVDSGSTDGTESLAESSPAVTRVLHNPGGEPAGSRNLGATHARSAALAFTDADCEPEPGWLAAGLRGLERADIVQGRVEPVRPPGPFDRTVWVSHEYGLYETANLFVRRETFERVGGFLAVLPPDQRDAHPFGEDAWFVWRARRAGALTAFAEDALVRHAVFERSAREYVAERARTRLFPPLVALIPELRDTFLHRRLFLSPESARFDLALAGAAAGVLSGRRALLAAGIAPYAIGLARQAGLSPRQARLPVACARVASDALTFASLIRGSIAARTLVL
jgi:glycosyltransferase involved in cell wall biosynthesis